MAWLGLKLLGTGRAVLDFFRTPAGRWVLVALAVALALLVLWFVAFDRGEKAGVAKERKAQAARVEKAKKAASEQTKRSNKITGGVNTDAAKKETEIRFVTKTLIEKVPVYVPASADHACVVNRGFVQLHDAAATGNPPPVPSPTNLLDAPSGVELSTVGATVVGNYGSCRIAFDRLSKWDRWYDEQAASWEAYRKASGEAAR